MLAAVELLYQKMLADPRLSKFFVGVDMEKLMKHQARRPAPASAIAPASVSAAGMLVTQQLMTRSEADLAGAPTPYWAMAEPPPPPPPPPPVCGCKHQRPCDCEGDCARLEPPFLAMAVLLASVVLPSAHALS